VTAQSTALRFRNRERVDNVDSFLDSVGNLGGVADRILTDFVNVTEVSWATEISKRVGDKIESFSDGETYSKSTQGPSVILNNTTFPRIDSIGTYQSDGAFTHIANHPATVIQGQLLVYFITISQPAGFDTSFVVSGAGALTGPLNSNQFYPLGAGTPPYFLNTQILYKIADGTEGGTTFTITPSQSNSGTDCVAHCFAISNHDTDNLPTLGTSTFTGWGGEQDTTSYASGSESGNIMWMYLVAKAKISGFPMPTVSDWNNLASEEQAPDNQIELDASASQQTTSGVGHIISTGNHGSLTPGGAPGNAELMTGDFLFASFVLPISNGPTSPFVEVTDSLAIEKSQSIILFDSIPVITDAGFITDKDLIRNRLLSDSLSVADSFNKSVTTTPSVINFRSLSDSLSTKDFEAGNSIVLNKRRPVDTLLVTDTFQKTVTTAPGVVYSRTTFDDVVLTDSVDATITRGQAQSTIYSRVRTSTLEVTDAASPTFIGIVAKSLSDSIAVNDFTEAEYPKVVIESLDTSDQSTELRIRPRVVSENIAVTEKILVERTEIINEVTVSDSIAATDRFDATYIQFVQVSAEIVIGIEVQ
jgi:hypothetical protein